MQGTPVPVQPASRETSCYHPPGHVRAELSEACCPPLSPTIVCKLSSKACDVAERGATATRLLCSNRLTPACRIAHASSHHRLLRLHLHTIALCPSSSSPLSVGSGSALQPHPLRQPRPSTPCVSGCEKNVVTHYHYYLRKALLSISFLACPAHYPRDCQEGKSDYLPTHALRLPHPAFYYPNTRSPSFPKSLFPFAYPHIPANLSSHLSLLLTVCPFFLPPQNTSVVHLLSPREHPSPT
jgi:hypothetical protein